jgi:hypothetical protein
LRARNAQPGIFPLLERQRAKFAELVDMVRGAKNVSLEGTAAAKIPKLY